MLTPPPRSTLFPYTTLFRSFTPVRESSGESQLRSCRRSRSDASASPKKLQVLSSTCARTGRSEEHTSELQSLRHLVCRLLLEKKNRNAVYGNQWKRPALPYR